MRSYKKQDNQHIVLFRAAKKWKNSLSLSSDNLLHFFLRITRHFSPSHRHLPLAQYRWRTIIIIPSMCITVANISEKRRTVLVEMEID
jgi:hypothetical protein